MRAVNDPRRAIPRTDVEAFRDLALALADEARGRLRVLYTQGVEIKRKPDGSVVTSADLEVESRLREMIARAFPDHGILGEEYGAEAAHADFQWILDPVDGTEEFVRKIPTFGTVLALHYRGEPVVGLVDVPLLDARVHAAWGLGAFEGAQRLRLDDLDPATAPGQVRLALSARANFMRYRDDGALFEAVTRAFPNHRIYRSCYTHLCAATGQADATLDAGNPLWDIAAARILIEEAGGHFHVAQDFVGRGERIFTTVFGRPSVVRRVAGVLAAAG